MATNPVFEHVWFGIRNWKFCTFWTFKSNEKKENSGVLYATEFSKYCNIALKERVTNKSNYPNSGSLQFASFFTKFNLNILAELSQILVFNFHTVTLHLCCIRSKYLVIKITTWSPTLWHQVYLCKMAPKWNIDAIYLEKLDRKSVV